jgi:hypothetical protein
MMNEMYVCFYDEHEKGLGWMLQCYIPVSLNVMNDITGRFKFACVYRCRGRVYTESSGDEVIYELKYCPGLRVLRNYFLQFC